MVTQEKTGKSPCDTPKKTTVERADDRAVHASRPAPLDARSELIRQTGFVTDGLSLAARRFSISYFTLRKNEQDRDILICPCPAAELMIFSIYRFSAQMISIGAHSIMNT